MSTIEILFFSFVAVYKSLEISQVFAEKYLELVLRDRDKAVYILFLLILLLAKTDLILKERHNKENLVNNFNFSNGKVILTLLIKVVAFYIEFTVGHVQGTGVQGLVLRLFEGGGSLSL